jgi:Flp pilus assembly protein TadD
MPILTRLQTIDPLSFEENQLMASYWYQRENYTQALAFAERAKSFQPDNADLRNFVGTIYLKLGELQKALQEYNLAVKYAPARLKFQENLEATRKLVNR